MNTLKNRHLLDFLKFVDSDVPVAKTSRYVEPKSRSPSPVAKSSGDTYSLSIIETNKLRAKLGLKPLQVDPPVSKSAPPPKPSHQDEIEEGEEVDFDDETLMKIREEREKEGETFWKEKKDFIHAPAENLTEKRETEKLRERLALRKEKRRLETKLLESKGLADEDSDDDASAWVRKQKEAVEQKLLAEKRARELDELDNEFGVGELVESEFVKQKNRAYTERDLKGLKVMHGQERIHEGETVIMTLQDRAVLNEDDDVLVNPNMIDDEKFEKNVENRKLRPELNGYNVFDEIEFDSEGNLKGKSVLGKYDEEIGGQKAKGTFVIGEDTSEEARRARIREKMIRANKVLESIESSSLQIASDFYTPDEMTQFKKPKNRKKIRKVRKVLKADDLLQMDADTKPTPDGVINQRDLVSRKSRKKTEVSPVIKVENEPVDMEIDVEIDDLPPPQEIDVSDIKLEDEGDLDFQVALHKARLLKQKERMVKKPRGIDIDTLLQEGGERSAVAVPSSSSSIVLHATAEFCRTLGDIPRIEGADIYGDDEMDFEKEDKKSQVEERGTWNEVEIDETPVDITRPADAEESTILEQEPDVAVGIAGALKVAMNKGYLDKEDMKRGGPSKMRHLQVSEFTKKSLVDCIV